MEISTKEFKQISLQMDAMREFIQQHPEEAGEFFYTHPEFHTQIKEIVTLLRSLQEDLHIIEEEKNRISP